MARLGDQPFHASVRWETFGPLRAYRVESGPLVYVREAAHVRRAADRFFVLPMPQRAEIVREQGGVAVVAGPGQATLGDSAATYRYTQLGGGEVWSLRIDGAALSSRLRTADARGWPALDLRRGAGRLALDLLGAGWRRAACGEAGEALREQVGAMVVDLLATALDGGRPEPDTAAGRAGLRARATRVIQAELGDPDLSPARVAAAIGVSRRYLDVLFADAGTSVMRYVREQRLERCHRTLAADGTCGVAAVAHRHGFRDAAHFSRAFRARYGVAPRDVRGTAAGTG